MTVNNSANKTIIAGNGVATLFSFSFIAVDPSDISVITTDSSGNQTTLTPSQYTLALNPVPTGQIWALGGSVTYPLVGSPLPLGSTLTIVRNLSLTQLVALGNQGNEFPSAVETALDLIEMQLQQVSELFQRAIVAPVVDASAPLPLPPATQRANQGMGFDASGNPVALALPASGAISSAMQPVVDAATLALGRTAFGLGNIATDNIGSGLQSDGAGGVRVNSPITQVATSQIVDATFDLKRYLATGPINFTLPRANTLFNGFGLWIYNTNAGAVTLVIDSHDSFQGYASGVSVNIPPDAAAFISTDAATSGTWLIEWALATAPPMAAGEVGGLSIQNNAGTPNTKIDVAFSEAAIPNLLAGTVRFGTTSLTIDCTVTGPNGMDNTPLLVNTWYAIWLISNGSSVAGLVSASFTAPSLPSGYAYQKRIGAMRADSSNHLLRTRQTGNKAVYTPVAASNTTTPPVMISISASGGAAWTAIATGTFVPSTATQIKIILSVQIAPSGGVANYFAVVPSNGYPTTLPSTAAPLQFMGEPATGTIAGGNQTAELTLESSNIYYGSAGSAFTNATVSAYGWTDNL